MTRHPERVGRVVLTWGERHFIRAVGEGLTLVAPVDVLARMC